MQNITEILLNVSNVVITISLFFLNGIYKEVKTLREEMNKLPCKGGKDCGQAD